MRLRLPALAGLFLPGAVAALVGDHGHVATGTTEYLTSAVPFVWSSPIWFPALVGLATASLAELRLHLPNPRTDVNGRQALGGVAAVVGTYLVTAVVHEAPPVPATGLICALAAITWCVLGDRPAVVCGVLAAVIGPVVEIALVELSVFRYADASDQLLGVGPWLVPLYFVFGVVAALLGELAARPRGGGGPGAPLTGGSFGRFPDGAGPRLHYP